MTTAKAPTKRLLTLMIAALCLPPGTAFALVDAKPATASTIKANEAIKASLPFNDKQDFADAERGFIAKPETLTIKDDKGNVVWDLEQYKAYIGLDKAAPDTVNPSL
nr:hypothetical protein [Aeromonas bivalvium]